MAYINLFIYLVQNLISALSSFWAKLFWSEYKMFIAKTRIRALIEFLHQLF